MNFVLPFGYDPKNYDGRIWWNENNPRMRAIWGTQAEYNKHIQQGGTWLEYEKMARERMNALIKMANGNDDILENNMMKR